MAFVDWLTTFIFVASSGGFYAERHGTNRFLKILVGAIALFSFPFAMTDIIQFVSSVTLHQPFVTISDKGSVPDEPPLTPGFVFMRRNENNKDYGNISSYTREPNGDIVGPIIHADKYGNVGNTITAEGFLWNCEKGVRSTGSSLYTRAGKLIRDLDRGAANYSMPIAGTTLRQELDFVCRTVK